MGKRVAAVGTVLLVVGGAIVAASYTVGSPPWSVVFHRPAFRAGLAVGLVGAVMCVLGVFRSDTEVLPEHRGLLRGTARMIEAAVKNYRRLDYGDTAAGAERRRVAFEIHFRRSESLLRSLREWDSKVHALDMAKAELRTHLHIRKDELGIQEPTYDESLIETLYEWTVTGAKQNEPPDAIGINWWGFDDVLSPAPSTASWIRVTRLGGETDDEWRERVDEKRQPVDQLLQEAQTWPEARRIGPLWKDIRGLRGPTSDAIGQALLREKFLVARRCPFCKENRQ
jgi:hypothetical protein